MTSYHEWRPLVEPDLELLDEGQATDADLIRWSVPLPAPEGWETRLREWGVPYLSDVPVTPKEKAPTA
jgi:hypothetical protein